MLLTRAASPADAPLIAAHRKAMFVAMGRASDSSLETMTRNFEPWCTRMIAEAKYIGWVTEDDGRPIASAGLLVLDWPPHPLDPYGEKRAYILNVFVDPDYRRRGLAHALVDQCVAEAHRLGLRVVALHTSEEGRHLYEVFGFRISNEMLYVEPDEG